MQAGIGFNHLDPEQFSLYRKWMDDSSEAKQQRVLFIRRGERFIACL